MDVPELQRKQAREASTTKKIYNPDKKDFTCKYDNQEYTIRAGEIQSFPTFIAEHIGNALADHILNQRGPIKGNYHAAKVAILKEIEYPDD